MPRFDYTLTLRTPREITPDEIERVVRAALAELAAICDAPDAAPRVASRTLAAEPEQAKAA
jgi:hypothetical protein